MSDKQRRRRPELERTGPIRNFTTLLKPPGTTRDPAGDGSEPHPGAGEESTIARAVKLGYRVYEEQIRLGRSFAARLASPRSPESRPGTGDLKAISEQILGYYVELGRLSLELIEALARGPLADVLSPDGARREAEGRADPAAATTALQLAVEVVAARPTEVKLDLRALPPGRRAMVHALRALDPSVPALEDVTALPDGNGSAMTLRVTVPDAQPPALYTGAVVDAQSNEPWGTLSVRVGGETR